MIQSIKRPATIRELGDRCQADGISVVQGLEAYGPWPTPPEGYSVDPHSDTRWLGPETYHRKWIITPVWNSTTDTHSFNVWLAEHHRPNYAHLSLEDALELAAALMAAGLDSRA